MSFVGWCQRCEADGIRSPVNLYQINFSEAVQMCARPQCLDLLKYANNISALFVKRDHRQCVTKALVPKPSKAMQPLPLPPPLPTESCPVLPTEGGQEAAPKPTVHLYSKEEAPCSSSEPKASDSSEVCCGGKVLMVEAVSSPVTATVKPFSSSSVSRAMPVAPATSTDTCEASLPCVVSVDLARSHPKQSEPCRQAAPPPYAVSDASGEKSLLPVATCGGSEEKGLVRLEDDSKAGIPASGTRAATSAKFICNGKESRNRECGGAAEVCWTVQSGENNSSGSSQVEVAALVNGGNVVPSRGHTAPNGASEKPVAAAIHGDGDACLLGKPPIVLQKLQADGKEGTGHYDIPALPVSGCAGAGGELNPKVSTEDPIASSLWIAETLFSLQCGQTQVARNSVSSEECAAVCLPPLEASEVRLDRTEDAFRDSRTDCVGLRESAHQCQSEATEYVVLKPLPPRLSVPAEGLPFSEQKGCTIVREDVVFSDGCRARAVPAAVTSAGPASGCAGTSPVRCLPCTVPAQTTPAAVSTTPGNASARAAQKNASASRAAPLADPNAAVAGTSSGSGRPAQKSDTRAPSRWANTVHGTAASSPARTNRARQKRGASPPRLEPKTITPVVSRCYVDEKFAKIREALAKVEQAPKLPVLGRNMPEYKRMPGRKQRKDARTKRQAGPQSQQLPSSKRILKLAFGRPPKLRRNRQAEQVVPDMFHTARSPTPSDYSSQSSKPSSNCPSSPASCISSGSDLSTTNVGSSSVSGGANETRYPPYEFKERVYPPYEFKERVYPPYEFKERVYPPYEFKERVKAPVKIARRGSLAKKGPTDIGAEVDRYVSELSHYENYSQFDSVLSDLF